MIQTKCSLKGRIYTKNSLKGSLNNAIVRMYPQLEDLEITPTAEEQTFKSDKYGYNTVNVKAIKGETLEITPTAEEQNYSGVYSTVNVKKIETTELNIIPSSTEQVEEGIFSKVTVSGDSELVPENIKKDVEIFGVVGSAELRGEENAILDDSLLPTVTAYTINNALNRMLTKIPNIDTSKWTSAYQLFYFCINLKEIPMLDTSNVTDMFGMFNNCSNITTIPPLNTSKVEDMNSMFTVCSKLITVPELDASNVSNVANMFSSCSNLTNFGGLKDLGKAFTRTTQNYSSYKLSLSSATKLTHESLMNVINNLYDLNLTYDVANGGTLYTQTLQLGSTNLAKLTAEEIAIATNKGWNVS